MIADVVAPAKASMETNVCEHPTTYDAVYEGLLSEICCILDISQHELDLSASFMQLGGHSLAAISVMSACKSRGLHLPFEAILRSNSIAHLLQLAQATALPALESCETPPTPPSPLLPVAVGKAGNALDAVSCTAPEEVVTETHAAILFDRLLAHSKCKTTIRLPDPSTSIQLRPQSYIMTEAFPMTEMQLSLIHGSQKHPGNNIISFFETYQSKDLPTMRKAWKAVIESEQIFGTSFDLVNGRAFLRNQNVPKFDWTEKVVGDYASYERELQEYEFEAEISTSFKVVTWQIGSCGPKLSTIIWRTHHALIDGYSAKIIYKKVRQATTGCQPQAGTPFSEIARGLDALQHESQSFCTQFWKQRHANYMTAAGDLLLAPPQNHSKDRSAANISFEIPEDWILSHARRIGVSTASIYIAAWAMVLSIYADSDSVVFGVVMSGRDLPIPGVDDTVGPLINTLPLHVMVDGSQNPTNFIRYVFESIIDLSAVQFSKPEDGYTRNFSTAVATEIQLNPSELEGVQPVGRSYFTTVTDIPLSISVGADGMLRLCYHRKNYDRMDMELLGDHYKNAIFALLAPHNTVDSCLDRTSFRDSRDTLSTFGNFGSDATTASSVEDDLVTLFERVVDEQPSALAIERGTQTLSYQELDRRADIVANRIASHVQPGDVVCVNADRSVSWIVAIYGILKAGGIYCPLEKSLPDSLRDSIFVAAGSKMFLVSTVSDMSLKPDSCNLCFATEELVSKPNLRSRRQQHLVQLRRHHPAPAASAYMCFTSGSTGKPKGVICSHEGLVAFQRSLEVRLFAEPGCKISQIMSPAFDGSIHEIFSALSYGATLILAHSPDPFAHLTSATSAILTPSTAKRLDPLDFPRLKNLYLVGEPVPQYVCDSWGGAKRLYNMYGPTEGTGGATIKRLLPGKPVTIGVPNPSTRLYILDRHQRLAPRGVVGEICIAGVQVARGYVGMPEETARRFLIDPVCGRAGERMYRTGDRGYWHASGEVECIGRNDRQIKLRGFRLDMNDIEIRIVQSIPTATAVAIAPKGDYLVAMIQPGSLDVSEVRQTIAKILQVHAMPRLIKAVDEFPLTAIGKIDYKAIAAAVTPENAPAAELLINATEKQVASAWRAVLNLGTETPITPSSNFAAIGGHSIAQMLLANKLKKLFDCDIPIDLIIGSPTLRDLASGINQLRSLDASTVNGSTESKLGDFEVTPMEREWWQKYQIGEDTSSFNVSLACKLDRAVVNLGRLATAWNTVLARHQVLKCKYVDAHDGKGVQRGYSEKPPTVHRIQKLNIRQEIHRPFRLDHDNPIRVTISDDCMVIVASHIICDLTTLQVLLSEVDCAYREKELPLIRKTLTDTTLWSKKAPANKLDFCSQHLAGAPISPDSLGMVADRVSYRGTSTHFRVPTDLYKCLVKFSTTQMLTLHQLSLAAVALALQFHSERTDIVLGGPYLNRQSSDDLETVGLFLEPLPIRIQYQPSGPASPTALFLRSVQASSQGALAHAVPWTQLLEHLHIKPEFPNHPLLDAMVTFHGEANLRLLEIDGVEPLLTWTEGAKFKLLCEFCAVSTEVLLLRIEHDTECFLPEDISRIGGLIIQALDLFMADLSFVEVKNRLRKRAENGPVIAPENAEVLFGKRLSEI